MKNRILKIYLNTKELYLNRIKILDELLPEELKENDTLSKMIRSIHAVLAYKMQEIIETYQINKDLLKDRNIQYELEHTIKGGYHYALSYLIDQVLDRNTVFVGEKKDIFKNTVLDFFDGKDIDMKTLIIEHNVGKEEREYFSFFKRNFDLFRYDFPKEDNKELYNNISIMNRAQIEDSNKELGKVYTPEELYIPIIIKAAFTRILGKSFVTKPSDEFIDNAFKEGIPFFQMDDDFTDFFKDTESKSFTPFTNYIAIQGQTTKSPFILWLQSLEWIIQENGYNKEIIEIIASRFAKYVKVFVDQIPLDRKDENITEKVKEKIRIQIFEEFLVTFGLKNFPKLKKSLVSIAKNRNHLLYLSSKATTFDEQKAKNHKLSDIDKEKLKNHGIMANDSSMKLFVDYYKGKKKGNIRNIFEIEDYVQNITKDFDTKGKMTFPLKSALEGGKYMRAFLASVTGSMLDCKQEEIEPLFSALEFLQTASLMLDDYDDKALIRRKQMASHHAFDGGISRYSALNLIFQGEKQIDKLVCSEAVKNKIKTYISNTLIDIINGQVKDISLSRLPENFSKNIDSNKKLEFLEELKEISYLKTGKAFEACFIPLCYINNASDKEIGQFEDLAKNFGILYQIIDDIKDVVGDAKSLGKNIVQDANKPTFVSVLGVEGIKNLLHEYFFKTTEIIQNLPYDNIEMKKVLEGMSLFVINRANNGH
jgi:geranylgeranyl pyrophosphate synthase